MTSVGRGRRWPSMLPRYSPTLAWREALRLVLDKAPLGPSALADLASALLPGIGERRILAAPSARQGLLAHYLDLHNRVGSGTIILPAQVCPVVPAVIRAAGHRPAALDGDGVLPTPCPVQYAAALAGSQVIGLLVAPMSGYVQTGWSALLPSMPPALDLVVDLAQSPFSADALGQDFLGRADAITFSFAVGKGFDTGGGLLVSKAEIPPPGVVRSSWPLVFGAVSRSAAIRTVIGIGAYRSLLPVVDRMAAADIGLEPVEQMESDIARCWLTRHGVVKSEFGRAATRSAALGRIAAVQRSCHAIDVTCTGAARPLRQLLRLRPAIDRKTVLAALRAAGLDCAAAGEPFPTGQDPHRWPHAEAFTQEALRLPFLGRFSAEEFDHASAIIEEVLTVHGL